MDAMLQVLATGGDVGVWVIVYAGWRLHSRVLVIETKLDVQAPGGN